VLVCAEISVEEAAGEGRTLLRRSQKQSRASYDWAFDAERASREAAEQNADWFVAARRNEHQKVGQASGASP
jgi:hypothetical protein